MITKTKKAKNMNGLKAIEVALNVMQGNITGLQGNIAQIQTSASETNGIVKNLSGEIFALTSMIQKVSENSKLRDDCIEAELEEIKANDCTPDQKKIWKEKAEKEIKNHKTAEEIKKKSLNALIDKYVPWIVLVVGTTIVNRITDIWQLVKKSPQQYFIGGIIIVILLIIFYRKFFKK